MNRYLRDRPFLVVNVIYRPSDTAKTSEANWQNDDNALTAYETVSFPNSINTRHMRSAAIIIDIIKSTVIRNKSSRSDDDVMVTYVGKYSSEIKKLIAHWAGQQETV